MNEYMYFNRQSGLWSDKACKSSDGSSSSSSSNGEDEQYGNYENYNQNQAAEEEQQAEQENYNYNYNNNNGNNNANNNNGNNNNNNNNNGNNNNNNNGNDEENANNGNNNGDDAAEDNDGNNDNGNDGDADANEDGDGDNDNGDGDNGDERRQRKLNMFTNYGHRCVKMDCHLPNTHYKLLGIFKEPHYDEWMEQLFKHQGDCVWDDFEYQFMQMNRDSWPNGCTEANIYDHSGNMIYYDLKPEPYGSMSVGLYLDNDCVTEYNTGGSTVQDVLDTSMETYYDQDGYVVNGEYDANGNYGGEEDAEEAVKTIEDEIEQWNNAFDVFKQCQPCKTFNLVELVAGLETNSNSKYYNATGQRHVKNWQDWAYGSTQIANNYDYNNNNNYNYYNNDDDDDGEPYKCHDDADYDDVNQVRVVVCCETSVLCLSFWHICVSVC